MSGFILLLWISIIVILNARGEIVNDNSLCEHCNSDSLAECLEPNNFINSVKIRCQRQDQPPCILAIVKGEGENDKDFVCLQKEREELMNDLLEAKKSEKMLEENLTTELSSTEMERVMSFDEDNQVPVTQSISEVVVENDRRTPVFQETTVSQIKVITVNAMDTTDPTVIVVITADNNPTNTQSNSHMDPGDYPQADQAIPEPNAHDEKSLINNGNAIESTDVVENSKSVSEGNETPNKMQPNGTNSLDNSITVISIENSFNCFGCESTKDSSCLTRPTKEVVCKTMGDTPIGCFTLLKDNQLKRGCLEDLEDQQNLQCLSEKDKSCHICFDQRCNNEPWPQCYVCQSNFENRLCSLWTPQTALTSLMRICPAYDDVCQLEITEAGATKRSCAAQSATCNVASVKNCRACNTTICNGGIFPIGRPRCHQCADTSKCALQQTTNEALPCPIYDVNESCYFFADDVGKMHRGCTSSLEDFKTCLLYDAKRCITCRTSNGCNSQALMVPPKLSCSQCDTRVKNRSSSIGCGWSQTMESVVSCKNNILYYLNETCEIIYQPDIDLAIRGCSHDIGVCEPTYARCKECTSNACNTRNLIWQQCLQCSSEHISDCRTNSIGITSEQCKSNFQPYETRGCYTSVNLKTNVTTRGCISDLSSEEMDYCKVNKKFCIFCYEQGCNNLLAPSCGNQVLLGSGFHLLLLGLIFSCL